MFQRVCMRMTAYMCSCLRPGGRRLPGRRSLPEAQAVAPELKLEGVRFRVYRGDALRAFGEAETASLRRDSTEVRARNLVATLPARRRPGPHHRPARRGLAPRPASSRSSGGVAVARGDDVARTAQRPLRARPRRRASSRGDEPVVVEGRGYRLDGAGFTLDPAAGDHRRARRRPARRRPPGGAVTGALARSRSRRSPPRRAAAARRGRRSPVRRRRRGPLRLPEARGDLQREAPVTLTREDATLTCRRLVAQTDEAGQICPPPATGDVRLRRAARASSPASSATTTTPPTGSSARGTRC